MDKTIRVALYMRVSTDQQAKEGDSIPAQRDALHKYAEEHGHIIVDEYVDEGISGRKFKERDELQRMLDDVQNGKIDIILFTKLDRFYRSIRHYTATQETLDKYNVGWLAIWEPIYDTTTPAGRLIVNQMMSIAQFEAENTSARIKQVFAYKVSKGEVTSHSFPPGYSVVDKHLVVNEDAPMILDMFKHYAASNSMRKTTTYLEVKYGFTKDYRSVKRYLSNPLYIGHYRGNEAYCEPIVPKELFDEVQVLLSKNIKYSVKYDYIFTGLVKCADCGHNLTVRQSHGYSNTNGVRGRKLKFSSYYCRFGISYHHCDNGKVISEKSLERQLLKMVLPEIKGYIAEYEVKNQEKKPNKAKISSLQEKIKRTKDLYVAGMIDLEQVKRDVDHYQSIIDELTKEETEEKDLSALKEFLVMDFETMYKQLTIAEKRRVWNSILKEITFGKDRKITFSFW